MGNRVSVSFINDGEESVALFNHWGGKEFVDKTIDYVKNLRRRVVTKKKHISDPISRLEPDTVMVDFIRAITANMSIVRDTLYLGKDSSAGDNSDAGHWVIDVIKVKAKKRYTL